MPKAEDAALDQPQKVDPRLSHIDLKSEQKMWGDLKMGFELWKGGPPTFFFTHIQNRSHNPWAYLKIEFDPSAS